jgi:hypothetical protein
MSDEQPVSSPDEQVPSAISPKVEEKPRRKPRKPSEPKSQGLPTTEAGEKVADGLRRKLVEMVDAAALTEANRRRATAIDATDYEAGFDRIAGPAKPVTTVAIVADATGAIGTGSIGYSINIYTENGPDFTKGHLAMLSGCALLIISVVLKYANYGK